MKRRRPSLLFLLLLPWTLLSASCQREAGEEVLFRTWDVPPGSIPTRSLLTASDIEMKKTGITLAAYDGGSLASRGHFTTNLDAMALTLESGKTYTLYALVNMGDLTGSLPLKESGLKEITYTIPSYTEGAESLAARGLPMAGKLTYSGQGAVIPVQRLLAKVTADLSCTWPGAAIRSVRVCNLNRTLRPFGEAARETEWDGEEFQQGTGTASGTFTFYVPENRQGSIGGIQSAADRSPDHSAEVRARSSRLTYLETRVEGTGTYQGFITYRSYLGQDAASDFNILRNAHYRWTIRFLPDGLQYDDWKHENGLIDIRTGLSITDGWDDGGESELN